MDGHADHPAHQRWQGQHVMRDFTFHETSTIEGNSTSFFRDDINGIRAIAVMAVLFFHFEIAGFKGGFVGVDMFFVISGYLMTSIIVKRMNAGQFSLIAFYLERAIRIIPALAAVCLAVLAFAYAFLPPQELRVVGKHVGTSMTFMSNLIYSMEGDYFDSGSAQKWLLHTWSLSVEWQFYLIYPCILIIASRFIGFKRIRYLILMIFLASLTYSIHLSSLSPRAAFYLLPSRTWEMMLGGLVFLFPLKPGLRWARTMVTIGVCMLLASMTIFSSVDVWPGWRALIPAIGTAMVIAAAHRHIWGLRFTLVQWIGKISYSIYLWHWPLVVGLMYLNMQDNITMRLAFCIASVVCGYISYVVIESKFASLKRRPFSWTSTFGMASLCIVLISAASAAFISGGFVQRASPAYSKLNEQMSMASIQNGWCFYSVDTIASLSVGDDGLKCSLGDKTDASRLRGLLFGDSFAGQMEPFWDHVSKELQIRLDVVTTNWCFPAFDDAYTGNPKSRAFAQCKINRMYLKSEIAKYDFVVLAGQWESIYSMHKLDSFLEVLDFSARQARLVILMESPVKYDTNVALSYLRGEFANRPYDIRTASIQNDALAVKANRLISDQAKKYANVLVFKRESMYSVGGVESRSTPQGIPFAFDANHVSIIGALAAADSFKNSDDYASFLTRLGALKSSDPNSSKR